MNLRNYKFHDSKRGAAIHVRVIPRSAENEIVEILSDGVIKIRLKASPVDGKANELLIEYLSKILDISKNKIAIIAGLTKKDKLISIMEVDPIYVHQKLSLVCIKNKSS